MTPLEVTGILKAVLDAEDRALAAGDVTAYEALGREEARLMDVLRVFMADATRQMAGPVET